MAIQQLIDSLYELNEVHLTMIKCGESKKEAIMANDMETLIGIMNQESKIMKQISNLEEQRLDACQAFLREKGIKSRLNLNLTELTRLVFDPAEKEALKNVQAALSWTLQELKRLNDLNQKLIEQSLAFVNYSIELLGAPPEQEATYKPPTDKYSGSKGPGYFDARA
ncbi:flagellar protein FlgN [Paenibacillus sp. M1]|uniref:Flagellar protein FlgN n=1 Tax=Paenibacillus haidiansis TaxID=1574488 RepID=A0ABU7VWD1_9BACL